MRTLRQLIPLATPATSDFTSESEDFFILPVIYGERKVGLQVIATSLDAADSTVKLQESNDDVNYSDIPGASITLASGSSIQTLSFSGLRLKFVRAVFTKNANAAGTISGIANLI